MALKDFCTLISVIINLIFIIWVKRRNHYKDIDIDDWVIDTIEYLGYI